MQPFLQGKRVLITGGGGSIGSELCRQAAAQKPAALAAADISENGLFAIREELWTRYGPDIPFQAVIASIRDRDTLSCSRAMEAVGLKAARITSGIPVVMPPRIPPA